MNTYRSGSNCASNRNSERRPNRLCFEIWIFLLLASSTEAATISVGNTRGYPGQTATAPITARAATNIVAAQFDLAYNAGKGTLNPPALSGRYSNHVMRSREISPGMRRVLVYSTNNALLRTNSFSGSFSFNVPVGERVGRLTPCRSLDLRHDDAPALSFLPKPLLKLPIERIFHGLAQGHETG